MNTRPDLLIVLTVLSLLSVPGCKKKPEATPAQSQAPAEEAAPGSSDESGNRPPSITRVTISPVDPKNNDEITVEADATDQDGDNVTLTYQWYINGEKALGEIGNVLRPDKTVHGDRVEAEVIPNDGKESGAGRKSGEVTVRNSSPQLQNEFKGGINLDGFRLQVTDPDDDPITFTMTGAPPNMSIDPDGTIHWKPRPDDKAGEYEVTVIAADGQGGNVTVKFPVKVNPPRGAQPSSP